METYIIKRKQNKDYEGAAKAHIDNILWGSTYETDCYAQLIFVEGKGFYAKIYAKEENPRMTYKPYDFSDDVCDDSCVEWFMDFLPGNIEGYMNLEATACAAINCCTGTGRNGRIPLNERFGMLPEITAGRSGEYWWVEYFVSLELIHRVYGDIDLGSGAVYRGNFYKCGELTPSPHYFSWADIDLPNPEYHCPNHFGRFIME